MQMKQHMVDDTLPVAEALFKNWLVIRKHLQLAMSDQPIERDQDHAFLQLKSNVSKGYTQLRNRLPRQLAGSLEKFQDVMKRALSITHVRNLPPPDRRALYKLWHSFYLDLCYTLGALKYMNAEKYFPKFEEKQMKASDNLKASFVKESQGK